MRKKLKYLSAMLAAMSLFVFSDAYALKINSVTVSPNQTNNYAKYDISMTISNGNSKDLAVNTDSVIVIFNASTFVPSSITPYTITVNNTAANVVDIHGQRVSILTPVNIPRGGTISLSFAVSANIKNPSSAGNYTLDAGTSIEGVVTYSSGYTISASTSTVSAAAVTPNPSVGGEAADYLVSFTTGSGGGLTANTGTITITFPSGTTVPAGALSGVTINGTAAIATATDTTVVITTPIDIENNGAIDARFAVGTGLKNPTTDGTYTVDVKTSSETTDVISNIYTISPAGQLSITAIDTKPAMVNQGGEFIFDFRTGSSGGLSAVLDSIYIIFPQNTFLPTDMSPLNISVISGGFSDNAYAIDVQKADATDEDTLAIVTPINIGNSSDVTVAFNSSAGYLNPSIAGYYSIGLKTSKDRTIVQSNPFAVFNTNTTVSQAIITAADARVNRATSYTVDFNLGSRGRLKPGESTITLTFHNDYQISTTLTNYNLSTIKVGQGTPVSIPTSLITPNNTAKTIQITVPSSVLTNNGDNVVIYLSGSTNPITNPGTAKNYNINVKTSVEATDVLSATYNIGGTSITINSVTLTNSTVNTTSGYTFGIRTSSKLNFNNTGQNLDKDYITIIFPEGTTLPSTISDTTITISGTQSFSVSSSPATRTVTAVVGADVNANSTFNVIISSAAGIVNPVVPSATFYKVTMSTSTDESPVTSSAYTISSGTGQVTGLTASASPAVINASNSVYTIGFTTSAAGKLAGGTAAGSSTITIDFDNGTIVPASMTASTVEVNATPCENLSVTSSGAGGAVQLTVPNGLTIGNSTAATVKFLSNSGLTNGSTAGTYNINVKTSSDNAFADTTGASGNYSILLTQPLFVSSVTPSPTTQNASAGYSVKFTTGSTGALTAGDEIRIVFPSNTGLPATVSKTDVTVNGVNPTVNPTISTNTLIIKTPVSINNLTASTVLLNQAMGIINPTVTGSYTLNVITTAEAGPFTSPTYSITQTTSTVTAANVTPASATPSAATSYTVNFKVGANGRLLAGTSTITITYGSATGVSTTLTNYNSSTISVNSGAPVSIASNISVSSKSVIITVPSGVTIGNNANLSIVLDGTTKPITNPSSSAFYTLQVKTSVEPTNITSNSYAISSTGPVTGITAGFSTRVVNAVALDTVKFRIATTGGTLSGGSGTITITFPFNTLVPSSITASNIRVANGTVVNPTNFTATTLVVTNSSTRTVTLTVPNTISNSNYVSVAFATAAGIMNPSILGSYTLKARTSVQPVDGTSAAYTMLPTTTTISNLTVTISPAIPSTIARYQYDFQTGSLGRLVSGTSTISLLLPDDATFTQGTPATSKVTVNSTAAEAVVLRTGTATNPDTLIITVPSSVTIGNSSNVSVVIDQSAGLQNASIASNLIYSAYTSVENTPVANSNDTSLPVSLTSFKASAQDGRVILQWETESELENAYWMIEKKLILTEELEKINDGQLDVNETNYSYSLIEKIPGQGNSSVAHSYEYADTSVTAGGIYSYRLADVSITGQITYHSPVIQEIAIPSQFMLGQNYPNPFNPTTTIKYQLATDSKVTLKIYNVLGQEVYTLVNGTQKAGLYKLLWDGRNNSGVKVSSGLYIYRIEADTPGTSKKFSDIKKMVFIK